MNLPAFLKRTKLSVAAHRLLINLAIKDRTPVETFSQAGEDVVLQALFEYKARVGELGTYVDVGAYHPITYSNTHYFHKRGWKGINIEPRPGSKALFDKYRPLDTNLELAVSDTTGSIKFFHLSDTSTINTTTISRLSGRLDHAVVVPCDTLDNILGKYLPRTAIDFVSIDAEGAEGAIVESTNWRKWRPRIILVEQSGRTLSDFVNSPVTEHLTIAGYALFDLRRLYWPPAERRINNTPASLFFGDNEFFSIE